MPRSIVDHGTVTVPTFTGERHLALTPRMARVLRAQLSRAINADLPVLLTVSASAGGPQWKILTVNEDPLWAPRSHVAVGQVVLEGDDLAMQPLEDVPFRDSDYQAVLVNGHETPTGPVVPERDLKPAEEEPAPATT